MASAPGPSGGAEHDGSPQSISVSGGARTRAEDAGSGEMVLIEERTLIRECLAHALKLLLPNRIIAFPSIAAWLAVAGAHAPGVVVIGIRPPARASDVQQALGTLAECDRPAPIIVMCDVEDPWQIVDALERGARGYMLTSISLDVAAQAVRLVMAGGVFAPASSLIAAHPLIKRAGPAAGSGRDLFTSRQAAVVEALCRGRTNKDIAAELDLCESTVQVHVRNIMKKLNAKNRTEVAFIANHLANGTMPPPAGRSPVFAQVAYGGGGSEAG